MDNCLICIKIHDAFLFFPSNTLYRCAGVCIRLSQPSVQPPFLRPLFPSPHSVNCRTAAIPDQQGPPLHVLRTSQQQQPTNTPKCFLLGRGFVNRSLSRRMVSDSDKLLCRVSRIGPLSIRYSVLLRKCPPGVPELISNNSLLSSGTSLRRRSCKLWAKCDRQVHGTARPPFDTAASLGDAPAQGRRWEAIVLVQEKRGRFPPSSPGGLSPRRSGRRAHLFPLPPYRRERDGEGGLGWPFSTREDCHLTESRSAWKSRKKDTQNTHTNFGRKPQSAKRKGVRLDAGATHSVRRRLAKHYRVVRQPR